MRTILITGANRGLGYQTARALAGDQLVLACRDARQGQAAATQLGALFLPLDLARSEDVRQFPDRLQQAGLPPLSAIICNAGVQFVSTDQRTPEGLEMTFAVNHLAHFLLIRCLLPYLSAEARIWLVSSGTHDPTKRTGMPEPLYTSGKELAYPNESFSGQVGRRRYTTSKLCNVLCTYELARRLRHRGIRVNAFDPGLMPGSGLARDYSAWMRWLWERVLPHLPGASSTTRSGQDLAEILWKDVSGAYFSGRKQIVSALASYDEARQAELWNSSCELLNLSKTL